jgi:hypothetical protein
MQLASLIAAVALAYVVIVLIGRPTENARRGVSRLSGYARCLLVSALW